MVFDKLITQAFERKLEAFMIKNDPGRHAILTCGKDSKYSRRRVNRNEIRKRNKQAKKNAQPKKDGRFSKYYPLILSTFLQQLFRSAQDPTSG